MFSKLSYIFVPSLFVVSGLFMVLQPMYQKQESLSQLRYATANVRPFSAELQTTPVLPASLPTSLPQPAPEKKVIAVLPTVVPKTPVVTEKPVKKSEKKKTKTTYKDEIVAVNTPNAAENDEEVATNENSFSFCGENIPLENDNVNAKFMRQLNKFKKGHSSIAATIQLSHRYKAEMMRILKENGLHPDIFYIAVAESGLANLTSPRGAKGFWQFMPDAAASSGLEVSATVDERLHPIKATVAACKYFKTVNKMLHDWTLSAAAYNMGAGGVLNAISSQGTRNYYNLDLNSETGQYVYRIVAFKTLMENPSKYGIKLNSKNRYAPIPCYIVKVNHDIDDLADFAKEHNATLKELKMMNPWLISSHLDAKSGKTYEIRFPKDGNVNAAEMVAR